MTNSHFRASLAQACQRSQRRLVPEPCSHASAQRPQLDFRSLLLLGFFTSISFTASEVFHPSDFVARARSGDGARQFASRKKRDRCARGMLATRPSGRDTPLCLGASARGYSQREPGQRESKSLCVDQPVACKLVERAIRLATRQARLPFEPRPTERRARRASQKHQSQKSLSGSADLHAGSVSNH